MQQTYDDASSRQAAFAQGFSQQMQEAQQQRAGNTSSFLQNVVGAPSEQVGQVAGQVNPAAAGDTLYGLRGYIPASTLNQEGAAYTANAQQLPSIAHAQGLQQIGRIQSAQQAQDAKFAQDIASEAGKAPQYRQQIASDLFDQQYKKNSQALEIQKLRDSEANSAFDQKLKGAKFSLDQQVQAFNQKYKVQTLNLSVARLNQSAQKFAQQTLQSDRSYRLQLQSLGIRKASEQRKALADEYKLSNGGFTADKLNKLKGDAAAIAADAFNGFTDSSGKKYPPLNLGQALTEMRKGAGNGRVPLSVALSALEKQGFKLPAKYHGLVGGASGGGDPFAGNTGQVTVAPGADRAGVTISPNVTSFVAQVAGVAGVPLTITTGTNHNEFVVNTHRVSDHWSGNAADILYGHGSPGHPDPALTRLGQDALIAAGMPEYVARKQTGGLFNIGGKQIIFNSLEGGNHFNHLHVGVR